MHTNVPFNLPSMKIALQSVFRAALASLVLLSTACATTTTAELRPPEAMRPPSIEPLLQALDAAPREPRAHALAALAYADTDASGMTILWGLSYGALGGDADNGRRVAEAMARVLNERIKLEGDEGVLRLAPGAMPVSLQSDGSAAAPVVFVFELAFGATAVMHGGDGWTLADVQASIAEYAVSTNGPKSSLDSHVELHAWLRALAAAGHLDAFVAELFGPAFEAEYDAYLGANPTAVSEARAWMANNPFAPSHAVMPDDLVNLLPSD